MNPFDGLSLGGVLQADFSARLTQALVHFLWQGAAVGGLAFVGGWALRGSSARLRYAVHVAALLLMLACLPVTFALLPATLPPARPAPDAGLAAVDGFPGHALAPAMPETHRAVERPAPVVFPDGEADVAEAPIAEAPAQQASQSRPAFLPSLAGWLAPYTAAAYLLGVAAMLLRLVCALWGGHRLRRSASPVEDPALVALVARQARRIGMQAAPAVAWCHQVSVPVVVGIVRPMILLPASLATGLGPAQLEALVTHELAHIHRYDLVVNLLQRLVEALLFFHPAVWYVSRAISSERENCCDDSVLGSGCPRLEYAAALVRMAELCSVPRAPSRAALLAASGASPSQFKRRVLRVLEMDQGPRLRLSRGALVLMAVLPIALLLSPLAFERQAELVAGPEEAQTSQSSLEETPPAGGQTAAQSPPAAKPAGGPTAPATRAAGPASRAVDEIVRSLKQAKGRPATSAGGAGSGAQQPVAENVRSTVAALARGPAEDPVEEPRAVERLDVFVIDVSTGEVTLVAREPQPGLTYCGTPSWSSDGRRIVFDASPGRAFDKTRLQAIDVADGRARLKDLGPGNCPTLSPDGTQVAFLLNPGAVPGAQAGIWVMQADGQGRRMLGGYGIPKWSPDGKQLLITSFSSPVQLSLLDVATGQQQPIRLPEGAAVYSVPTWAGDGRTLVAVASVEGSAGIVLVDVGNPDQAQIKQVLWRRGDRLNVVASYPIYSAETGRCVFVGKDENGSALYSFDAGGFDPPKRLEADGHDNKIASLAFSPDGRYVLFCSDRKTADPLPRAGEPGVPGQVFPGGEPAIRRQLIGPSPAAPAGAEDLPPAVSPDLGSGAAPGFDRLRLVHDKRVYSVDLVTRRVVAHDVTSGKILWQTEVAELDPTRVWDLDATGALIELRSWGGDDPIFIHLRAATGEVAAKGPILHLE